MRGTSWLAQELVASLRCDIPVVLVHSQNIQQTLEVTMNEISSSDRSYIVSCTAPNPFHCVYNLTMTCYRPKHVVASCYHRLLYNIVVLWLQASAVFFVVVASYERLRFMELTLFLLTWRIWWAPNDASRWRMGFNLTLKGLNCPIKSITCCVQCIQIFNRGNWKVAPIKRQLLQIT